MALPPPSPTTATCGWARTGLDDRLGGGQIGFAGDLRVDRRLIPSRDERRLSALNRPEPDKAGVCNEENLSQRCPERVQRFTQAVDRAVAEHDSPRERDVSAGRRCEDRTGVDRRRRLGHGDLS